MIQWRTHPRSLVACLVLSLLVIPVLVIAQPENAANLPAQPLRANDLLSISVYGSPELTRTVRINPEGAIRLPMLRETIPVAGLMPAEIEGRIAEALESAGVLVDPAVSVTVAEYHSRPIQVMGAVKNPVTFQALGKTTLLEALARAQGLTPEAGREILVTHTDQRGETRVDRIPVRQLLAEGDSSKNLVLEGGEEIRVPEGGKVFVVGNVKRPGAYRAEDGSGISVLKALAMAEGLAPYASKQAFVIRRKDGGLKESPVELRRILDRKAEDVALEPDDIFYVPDNRSRRTTMNVIEKAVGFATATASGALVLSVAR
jgi:polysaccharide export outer membrane protein